jgi:hypothetical protein
VIANGEEFTANFVKIALNVVRRPGPRQNVLPELLRGWFGADAALPGRTDVVVFERRGAVNHMAPAAAIHEAPG